MAMRWREWLERAHDVMLEVLYRAWRRKFGP